MKQKLYGIVFGCMLIALTNACVIGEISDKNEYASQKLVFDYSESALYEMLYALDLSARVSAYNYAPSDSVRRTLKKVFSELDRLKQHPKGWMLENSSGTWLMESNHLPIEQQGAIWKISLSRGKDMFIPEEGFIVTAMAQNRWLVQVKNIRSGFTKRLTEQGKYKDSFAFESYGRYLISGILPIRVIPFYYNYTIDSGEGGFVPLRAEEGHRLVTVDYTIEFPLSLRYSNTTHLFSEGNIRFNVVDRESLQTDSFEAKISSTPQDREIVYK